VLVLDGPLHRIPFDVLVWDGQPLVKGAPLTLAPGLTLWAARGVRARAPTRGPVLAVGVDTFGGGELPSLPHAVAEARQIGEIYENARVVVGGSATKRRVLAGARDAVVLHFATHAVSDPHDPLRSRLYLSAANGSTADELTAHEIAEQPWGHLDLAVLSACRSADGYRSSTEGTLSLATAFLAAGAAAVIASRWEVEDRAANRLLVEFHREMERRGDPARALRSAKLRLLADPDPDMSAPRTWAGFELYSRSQG